MKRKLKMRERRSLRRYAQEFGGTLQVSFIAFRLLSFVLPILAFAGAGAYASTHTAVLAHAAHAGLRHVPFLMGTVAAGAPVMTEASKALRTKRSTLIQEMHDLTNNDASWNATDATKGEAAKRWKTLNEAQESIGAQVRAIEETEELRRQMEQVHTPANPQVATDPFQERAETAVSESEKRVREILESKEYRAGFVQWVRSGVASAQFSSMAREVRTYTALNTGTGSQGEFTIPVGFQRELEIAMKAYGGMRRNARIVPTSTGNALHWPGADDTANQGRWLAENAGVSQTNPTFSEIVYNAYLASSDQVLISVQLLQDSAFNIEALLAELLGIRLGRLTDVGYTTGSGSGQPTGLVTSILADASPNKATAVGSSGNTGGSETGATSIGTDDFASIIALVDPSYRNNAKFLAHWTILDYLKKVKDKFGRPIFVESVSVGQPDRIYGYPYDWSGAMDAAVAGVPVTGTHTVLFGEFTKYIIRDVLGTTMVRYNELYMPNHQVGFQCYLRTDGERLQQKAFSLLQQA